MPQNLDRLEISSACVVGVHAACGPGPRPEPVALRLSPQLGAVLLLAGFGLAGCHRHADPPSAPTLPAAHVKAAKAELRTEPVFEEVAGTVRARLRTKVEAKITGRITGLALIPGQAVQAGELLVRLDAQEYQARHDQAVAARDRAARDLDRYRELRKHEAVTQSEFDAATARFDMAQAGVLETQTLLGYTEVKAPFAGFIVRRWADPGDLAAPGRPLLELEDSGPLQFEANVPESLLPRLALGQSCAVQVATLTEPIQGKMAEIPPAGDPHSRTFPVKLDLPPRDGLRSGQFGRVSIPAGTNSFLRVPQSAVQRRGQLELVYVVTNQTARLRLVKTARQPGQVVELLSGVEPEELVVISGAEGLADGQPVRLLAPD